MIARSELGTLSLGPRRGERFRRRPSPPLQGQDPVTHPLPRCGTPDRCAGRSRQRAACPSPPPRSFSAALRPHSASADRSIVPSLLYSDLFLSWCPLVSVSESVSLSPSVNFSISCGNPAFVWVSARGSGNPSLYFPHPQSHCRAAPQLSGGTCRLYRRTARTPTETSSEP